MRNFKLSISLRKKVIIVTLFIAIIVFNGVMGASAAAPKYVTYKGYVRNSWTGVGIASAKITVSYGITSKTTYSQSSGYYTITMPVIGGSVYYNQLSVAIGNVDGEVTHIKATSAQYYNFKVTKSGYYTSYQKFRGDVAGTLTGCDIYMEPIQTLPISDPGPYSNYGSDAVRHPYDKGINVFVKNIIKQTSDPLTAARSIYYHFLTYFFHTTAVQRNGYWIDLTPFLPDYSLINEYYGYGTYKGTCRSIASLLTSFGRTVGLPARIIHFVFHKYVYNPEEKEKWVWVEDHHYIAEFYFKNLWVPVYGCINYRMYSHFGLSEAIVALKEYAAPGPKCLLKNSDVTIVTYIPALGLHDDGFEEFPYENDPYSGYWPDE